MRVVNNAYFEIISDFVNKYYDENLKSPTVREISASCRIPVTTVQRYLERLHNMNKIQYNGRRGVETEYISKRKDGKIVMAIYGKISCGALKLAQEDIEDFIELPVSMVGTGSFFILRADGDSMIEAGIDDGDLVIIRKQQYANDGQIVVAIVGDEATLKRFYRMPDKKHYRLHPENKYLDDIIVDECEIQGIAVKVIKDLL